MRKFKWCLQGKKSFMSLKFIIRLSQDESIALHFTLLEFRDRFIQSWFIKLFIHVILFTRRFLPSFSLEFPNTLIKLFLFLKFCWKFRSIQSCLSSDSFRLFNLQQQYSNIKTIISLIITFFIIINKSHVVPTTAWR